MIIALLFFCSLISQAQQIVPYDPKEEIVYDGKRYRVHNNWLSAGMGWAVNTHRELDQKTVAVDYNFHIRRQYFQAGAFMSGNNFTPGNNYNFHVGFGLRKETARYNLAAFVGPSASYFYRPLPDTLNYDISRLYNRVGAYASVQAVYKIKYDVGIGLEVFGDYNQTQSIFGTRIILYFSGAYRGIKKGHYIDSKKSKG
ncbi:MAG: hypothetical protein JST26_10745 [Bacteroidetes bacterium]|nr:hypothetical protein [Bacteroidota bacterium]